MSFEIKKFSSGTLYDAQTSMYPTVMHGRAQEEGEFQNLSSNYFGFVTEGLVKILRKGLPTIELAKGMYFSVPGPFSFASQGRFIVIERMGFRGLFSVGGPLEATGRLCYIDNCSVSQLVPPARLGDPTLQQLVFPPNVDQTMHLHPTLRMGFVHLGSGFCKLPDGSKLALEPGTVFYLPERQVHGFQSNKESMVIIAYHPETDVGPTDQSHPMLSRTYLQK
ncbi:MAG: cupin domain-containing protein [Bdellovibrionales bacterium]